MRVDVLRHSEENRGTELGSQLRTASSLFRSFSLEAAKALNPRETGIQVEGGGVGEDINLGGLTARVRHGLLKRLDGNFEAGFQRFRITDNDTRLANRNIFTARLGVKYAPIDHVALVAGLAGGGWTGGGFISPDVSLIFGYENPYCVPFVTIGGYWSIPVRENIVTLVNTGALGDEDYFAAPTNTVGWTVGTGIRVPISHDEDGSTNAGTIGLTSMDQGRSSTYSDAARSAVSRTGGNPSQGAHDRIHVTCARQFLWIRNDGATSAGVSPLDKSQ